MNDSPSGLGQAKVRDSLKRVGSLHNAHCHTNLTVLPARDGLAATRNRDTCDMFGGFGELQKNSTVELSQHQQGLPDTPLTPLESH